MDSIDIIGIKGAEVIPYLGWFNDVPERKRVDSESTESIIHSIMSGTYNGLLAVVNTKPAGLLIYHMVSKHKIIFKFMYVRSNMVRVYVTLMEYFNKYGIRSFEFESVHEPKLWNRIFPGQVKKIRSTYSFDIAELQVSKSQQKRFDMQEGANGTEKRI